MMKKSEKKEKNEYEEKKRDKEKYVWEKKKIIKVNSPILWSALGISKVSRFKIQTHFSNHVQSDNEDFLCASGSLFAICTCPPISKCVYFPPFIDITLFSNDLFDESR
jgi:hypothetical protein